MPESMHSRSAWKALEEEEQVPTPREAPSSDSKIKKGGGCGDDVKLPIGQQGQVSMNNYRFAGTGWCTCVFVPLNYRSSSSSFICS
jgi:hypothetical protein